MSNNDVRKIAAEAKRIIKSKNGEIRLLKERLTAANGERVVSFKMPAEMAVGNFPTVQRVKVENQPEVQSVKVTNVKEMIAARSTDVQRVHVVNQPEDPTKRAVEPSSWVPAIVQLAAQKVTEGFARIIARGVPVRLDASERSVPLTVTIVDLDGNPVDMASRRGPSQSPAFPMIMHGNVTTIAANCVSGRIVVGTTFAAGHPYQLPNVGAKRIVFTAMASNVGNFCIGGKTVSAAPGSETGSVVYPLGTAQIDVNSANVLWVDGSNSGDVLLYNILS